MSLSVSTWDASLPIAWRLYLPDVWCQDSERCRQAGVPEEIEFQTKPEIALEQIRQAMEQGSRWEWYWRMRDMGRACNSAPLSPNSDCHMQ